MTSMHLLVILGCTLYAVVCAQYGAVPLPDGLTPRYYLGTSPELQKRQAGVCAADEHSCLDINSTTTCCANDQYCVINNDFSPGCCAIGSTCGLPCGSDEYQCKSTATVSGSATVTAACCPRSCTGTSLYKCVATLGTGCCSFGYACQSGGGCTSTVQSTSQNAIASQFPSGCTTSQITCASSIGGGCCGVGSACTMSNNGYYCVSASQTAQRTGADGSMGTDLSKTTKHSGLSTGAKAGIGGGIAGVALLVAGGVLYFCIRQRRNNRAQTETSSTPAMSQKGGSEAQKPPVARRQTADYFGPTATAGPYTEDVVSPSTSPGGRGGVPVSPQSPGDIAAPVEIDSRDHSNVTSPGAFEYLKSGSQVKEYPFELP